MKGKVLGIIGGVIVGIAIAFIGFNIYNLKYKDLQEKDEKIITIEKQVEVEKENKEAKPEESLNKENSNEESNNDEKEKTIICDWCEGETNTWYFVETWMLCPVCEHEYYYEYDYCYECGNLFRNEGLINGLCYECYSNYTDENNNNQGETPPVDNSDYENSIEYSE